MESVAKKRKEMIALIVILGFFALLTLISMPGDEKRVIASASTGKTIQSAAKPIKPKTGFRKARSASIKLAKRPEKTPQAQLIAFPAATKVTITIANQPQLTKVDDYKNPLNENAESWNCVIDRNTGLVWEVKTNDQNLQDANHFYSWYSANEGQNKGVPGHRDNGVCRGGIDCDTESYIRAINETKLCGYSDWRLPTKSELMSLVQFNPSSEKKGLINRKFFPNGSVDWFWSSDTDIDDPSHAWYVLYYNGRAMKAPKSQAKKIRLVRGNNDNRSFNNVAENPKKRPQKLAIENNASPEINQESLLPSS